MTEQRRAFVHPPRDYEANAVAFRPPWAGTRLAVGDQGAGCAVRDCTREAVPAPSGCANCGAPLCRLHLACGELCAACDAGIEAAIANVPSPPQLPQRSLVLLFPCRGTELLTLHPLQQANASAPGTPCPFSGCLHWEDLSLPAPRAPGYAAAVTPFGSMLLMCSGEARGVALSTGAGEGEGGSDAPRSAMWWQVPLVPASGTFMAPMVSARAGVLRPAGSGWTCSCPRKVCICHGHIVLHSTPFLSSPGLSQEGLGLFHVAALPCLPLPTP